MASDIDAIAVVLDGAGDAADAVGRLEHDGEAAVLLFQDFEGGSQAGRTCADDYSRCAHERGGVEADKVSDWPGRGWCPLSRCREGGV